jgi:hypothetical protein
LGTDEHVVRRVFAVPLHSNGLRHAEILVAVMLIIPASKIDLRGLPNWFVIGFTVVYVALFAWLIGMFAYVTWQLI